MILVWPDFFGEVCFLEESYENMQKKSSFENFESALYSTSVSMPLIYEFSVSMISATTHQTLQMTAPRNLLDFASH